MYMGCVYKYVCMHEYVYLFDSGEQSINTAALESRTPHTHTRTPKHTHARMHACTHARAHVHTHRNYRSDLRNPSSKCTPTYPHPLTTPLAIFTWYSKMDKRGNGEVTQKDFFRVFNGGKKNALLGKFFRSLDQDQAQGAKNTLTFQEFAVMIYDFNTLRMDDLIEYAFNIFDKDRQGSLSIVEFNNMIKTVYGKGWKKKAENLEKKLDKDKDGIVTLGEFRGAEDECAMVLYPVTELQTKLQGKILGAKYWKKAQKIRYERSEERRCLKVTSGLEQGCRG